MTVEELLTLPVRVELLEMQMRELLAGPTHWQPVRADAPVLALWTPALSGVETEMLPYVAAGWSGQQIAVERGISERTVRTHISNILTKLNLTSRTEVALWALATGQVDMECAVRLMTRQQPHVACGGERGD